MTADLQQVSQVFAGCLLNTLFEGALIAVVLWTLLRISRRQNSSTRFALWLGALTAVAFLPLLADVQRKIAAAAFASKGAEFYLPGSWALGIFSLWLVIASALLLRLAVGLGKLRSFRATCREIAPQSLTPKIAEWWQKQHPMRHAKLCVSDSIAVPSVVGLFRPAVVLPAWLISSLSPDELKTILLHELAHLRRWDDWSNLFQKFVKAVFFFHPVVWWIEGRLALEREMACDDLVLAQSASPRAYAASLISFAEKIQHRRTLALAQALLGRMAQMSKRVAQILDSERPKSTSMWKPALVLGGAIAAVATLTLPRIPQLVAFGDAPALQIASTRTTPSTYPMRRLGESGVVNTTPAAKLPAARSIRAAFDPNRVTSAEKTTQVATHRAPRKAKTEVIRAAYEVPQEVRVPQALVIVQTQFNAEGAPVWTLCIWTVRDGDSVPQLESGIVLDLI